MQYGLGACPNAYPNAYPKPCCQPGGIRNPNANRSIYHTLYRTLYHSPYLKSYQGFRFLLLGLSKAMINGGPKEASFYHLHVEIKSPT